MDGSMLVRDLGITSLVCIALGWGIALSRAISRPGLTLNFGPTSQSRKLSKVERETLFYTAVDQQKSAYALFWFSVATGIALSALLIGRIILARNIDVDLLAKAVATTGDIALCFYANRAYRQATDRVDTVVKAITGGE